MYKRQVLGKDVRFARLGFAVVDEQHRFGVRQRGLLAEKAEDPHLLVMSATPIPRTLSPVSYTHLDVYKRQGTPIPAFRPPRRCSRPTTR